MHNAAFAALELDWAYVPLAVDPTRVGEAVRGLRGLGFVGANVTIPHKSAVLEHCCVVESAAQRSGSANTLIILGDTITATSTDGEGVAEGLDVGGAMCLVLGAGGASRPVIVALADAGAASVLVASRRVEAAEELASEMRDVVEACSIRAHGDWPPSISADLIVNATPIKDDAIVALNPEQQVVDLAYRADGTATTLVAAAGEAGCRRVIDGLEFLVRQGAASFERWTGRAAPTDVMIAAVRGSRMSSEGD